MATIFCTTPGNLFFLNNLSMITTFHWIVTTNFLQMHFWCSPSASGQPQKQYQCWRCLIRRTKRWLEVIERNSSRRRFWNKHFIVWTTIAGQVLAYDYSFLARSLYELLENWCFDSERMTCLIKLRSFIGATYSKTYKYQKSRKLKSRNQVPPQTINWHHRCYGELML